MADKVMMAIQNNTTRDADAVNISSQWTIWNEARAQKMADWLEVDKYLYAIDTSTTENKTLPWTHSTHIPKMTNIYDNLVANYMDALFPNDKWLKWEAHNQQSAKREVVDTVRGYMDNKLREGGFRQVMQTCLEDYVRRGNCFSMPTFETRYNERFGGVEQVVDFIGPKAVRISPEDIVFDPTATDFKYTPKIIRNMYTLGDIAKMISVSPENGFWQRVLDHRKAMRNVMSEFSSEDFNKASLYQVDGFGSLQQYYSSNYVEVLEFYGDLFDLNTMTLRTNRMITVTDRSTVVRDVGINTYNGVAPIFHSTWRSRPGNLWGMGPLDNLVGMQYRLNHVENMKANAMDLMIMSPKKLIGEVEEFEWKPNAEIHIDENGDVQELSQNLSPIFTANSELELLEARMELYAGAPREAMGIRTPGEKTMFEVQALENASGRIYNNKIVNYEVTTLEPLLNSMLGEAHRNLNQPDLIRVLNSEVGVEQFKTISKDDLAANGVIRPVGARHYAQKAQDLQNVVSIFDSRIGEMITPHTSSIQMTKFIDDAVNLKGYEIFKPNIAVIEQQETQDMMNLSMEASMQAQGQDPTVGPVAPPTGPVAPPKGPMV